MLLVLHAYYIYIYVFVYILQYSLLLFRAPDRFGTHTQHESSMNHFEKTKYWSFQVVFKMLQDILIHKTQITGSFEHLA